MAVDTDFSDSEKESIDELRNRMKGDIEPDLYEDKYFFYRFLKDQDFKINNAEAMIRKHLAWREKKDIKNALNYKKKEVFDKYFSYIFLGYDKEGCVLRYCPLGNIDFVGLANSAKPEDIEKSEILDLEMDGYYLKKKSEELGRNVDGVVYIYNLQHISFKTVTDKKAIHLMINFIMMYQNNYPERTKTMYLINSSTYFLMLFNILKKFMKSSVLNRIQIYTDDSYKEDILKVVDADVLPEFLGGKRTDPDGNPLCISIINHGGLVPETYYLHKSKRSLASMPGVKKVSLSNAAFHEEFLDVNEPGSYLEWEFETKCRDIGFGVFYEDTSDGDSKMVELIPHQRIDTSEYSEIGTYLCEKTGKYVVLFDNTYSWVRSKEIFYRIKIVTPEEQNSQLKEEMTA